MEKGSVITACGADVHFRVTDGKSTVPVEYNGVLPALFREGQGVVALGALDASGTFVATEVLAKHDEKYMPPEVVDALKKQRALEGRRCTVTGELGQLALCFALALSLVMAVRGLTGARPRIRRARKIAPGAAMGLFVFIALAFGALTYGFRHLGFHHPRCRQEFATP